MNSDPAHVGRHLAWHMGERGIDPTTGPALADVVKAQRERCKTLVDMAAESEYFYKEFDGYDEKASKKNFKPGVDAVLQYLAEQFGAVGDWEAAGLHQVVLDSAEQMQLNLGKVAQPLRVAVCGSGVSPAIDITLALMGKEKTLQRIERAIQYIKNLEKS
jgi:glutamyl-tRNA synthetase